MDLPTLKFYKPIFFGLLSNLNVRDTISLFLTVPGSWELAKTYNKFIDSFCVRRKNLIRIKNGGSFWWLEYKHITEEICLEAVKQNRSALDDIPRKFKTPEFCLAAVQSDPKAIEYINYSLQTTKVCLAAVDQDGMTLYNVNHELRSLLVCLTAVKQNKLALEYVPCHLQEEVRLRL